MECPLLRTALLQLAHEQAVRQHDQVHVPGLALDITQLTVAQPELLLAVPMERLRARPAMPVHPHDPTHLPGDPVRHQDLAALLVVAVMPQDDDPHLVLHVGDAHRRREVPLAPVADPHLLAVRRRDRRRQFAGLDDPALPLQLAVGLQVADVAPGPPEPILLAVDVVEDLGVGEVAVEGEVAGDLPLAHPVDQLAAQLGVVAERLLQGLADLLLAEEAELQRVVLAGGADVVDEEVVLGDLVPLLGVVPVPAGVGDQHPVPVDQGVVDGDDALVAVAGGGVLLEPLQAPLVEGLDVPLGLGEEAVEAGLVGGLGELVVDAEDGLPLGDEEAGEVLGEVAALALVGEEVAVLGQGVLDQLGELDDPWHDRCSAVQLRLDVPVGLGEKAIEARLVGGLGELVVDAEDGLPLGDEETGEVFGEVTTLALVGEEVAVLGQGILDELGELDDSWHEQMLRSPTAQRKIEDEIGPVYPIFTAT